MGGYAGDVSDVDLILVVADEAAADGEQLIEEVSRLELHYGVRKSAPRQPTAIESFFDRITANVRSFFVCSRSDLLSGEPARILEIPRAQAAFVDRAVIPNILGSAMTLHGEELLDRVLCPPLRRLDVVKSFQGLFNQLLLVVVAFPLLPSATRYAMAALKRAVHNCYFVYHLRPAPLAEEIEFFQQRIGRSGTLAALLDMRESYRPSFAFTIGCLPTVLRLHLHTLEDNRFPKAITACAGRR